MEPIDREVQRQQLGQGVFDVLVVGGGINGAASAAALSARGLKVALVEAGDFAGETSSASSCLVWGGIKYLQTLEFFLVRNLCRSRNTLMRAYPTQVPKIRFLAALDRAAPHRPIAIYAGTWLYWFIGGCFTRKPLFWPKKRLGEREPVLAMEEMRGGVGYTDGFLPEGDAHLVIDFIKRTWKNGGLAVNYTRALDGREEDGVHHTQVEDVATGAQFEVRSRAIVNAGGPWAGEINDAREITTEHRLVFSKGIHLVVPKISEHERVLTFFAADDRPFFVFPMGDRSCVGTTDTRVKEPESHVTEEDRETVLTNINRYLKTKLSRSDIISERCGVRPLVVNQTPGDEVEWTQLSRKHVLEADGARRFITLFGGKLTDCLNIGEEVCESLDAMGVGGESKQGVWFGEPDAEQREAFLKEGREILPDVDCEVLWRRHGAEAPSLLERVRANGKEAREMISGTGVLECEVRLAKDRGMVVTLEDYFRRRTLLLMTRGRKHLLACEGAREICGILFGGKAEDCWEAFAQAGDEDE